MTLIMIRRPFGLRRVRANMGSNYPISLWTFNMYVFLFIGLWVQICLANLAYRARAIRQPCFSVSKSISWNYSMSTRVATSSDYRVMSARVRLV